MEEKENLQKTVGEKKSILEKIKSIQVNLALCIICTLTFGLGGLVLVFGSLFQGASYYIGALAGYQVPAIGSITQLMDKDMIIREYEIIDDTISLGDQSDKWVQIQVKFADGLVHDIFVMATDATYETLDTTPTIRGALTTRIVDDYYVLVEDASMLSLYPMWHLIGYIILGLVFLAITRKVLLEYREITRQRIATLKLQREEAKLQKEAMAQEAKLQKEAMAQEARAAKEAKRQEAKEQKEASRQEAKAEKEAKFQEAKEAMKNKLKKQ